MTDASSAGFSRCFMAADQSPQGNSDMIVNPRFGRYILLEEPCGQTRRPRKYPLMTDAQDNTPDLIARAIAGDESALADLFERHRARLRQMVRLRLDRRLLGRVDPSDVLQEAYLDLTRELRTYHERPTLPFFLWLRLVTGQRLMRI